MSEQISSLDNIFKTIDQANKESDIKVSNAAKFDDKGNPITTSSSLDNLFETIDVAKDPNNLHKLVEAGKRDVPDGEESTPYSALTKYDKGLVYGMNQDENRAEKQRWWEQAGHSIMYGLVGELIGGTIANLGSLAAIPNMITKQYKDEDESFHNAITDFGENITKKIEEEYPIFRKNPEKSFDFGDSGYWFENLKTAWSTIGLILPGLAEAKVVGVIGKGADLLKEALLAGRSIKKLSMMGEVGVRTLQTVQALTDTRNMWTELAHTATAALHADNFMKAAEVSDAVRKEATDIVSQMSNEQFENFKRNNNNLTAVEKGLNKEQFITRVSTKAGFRNYNANLPNIIFDLVAFAPAVRGFDLFMNKTLTKGVAKAIEEEGIKTFEKGTMSWLKTKPYIKVLQEPAAMGARATVNAIAQMEGMDYGKSLLSGQPQEDLSNRMNRYITDPSTFEQGLWGFISGFLMEGATHGIGHLRDKIFGNHNEEKEEQARISEIQGRKGKVGAWIADVNKLKADKTKTAEEKQIEYNNLLEKHIADVTYNAIKHGNLDSWIEQIQTKPFQDVYVKNGIIDEAGISKFTKDYVESAKSYERAFKNYYRGIATFSVPEAWKYNSVGTALREYAEIQAYYKQNKEYERQAGEVNQEINEFLKTKSPVDVAELHSYINAKTQEDTYKGTRTVFEKLMKETLGKEASEEQLKSFIDETLFKTYPELKAIADGEKVKTPKLLTEDGVKAAIEPLLNLKQAIELNKLNIKGKEVTIKEALSRKVIESQWNLQSKLWKEQEASQKRALKQAADKTKKEKKDSEIKKATDEQTIENNTQKFTATQTRKKEEVVQPPVNINTNEVHDVILNHLTTYKGEGETAIKDNQKDLVEPFQAALQRTPEDLDKEIKSFEESSPVGKSQLAMIKSQIPDNLDSVSRFIESGVLEFDNNALKDIKIKQAASALLKNGYKPTTSTFVESNTQTKAAPVGQASIEEIQTALDILFNLEDIEKVDLAIIPKDKSLSGLGSQAKLFQTLYKMLGKGEDEFVTFPQLATLIKGVFPELYEKESSKLEAFKDLYNFAVEKGLLNGLSEKRSFEEIMDEITEIETRNLNATSEAYQQQGGDKATSSYLRDLYRLEKSPNSRDIELTDEEFEKLGKVFDKLKDSNSKVILSIDRTKDVGEIGKEENEEGIKESDYENWKTAPISIRFEDGSLLGYVPKIVEIKNQKGEVSGTGVSHGGIYYEGNQNDWIPNFLKDNNLKADVLKNVDAFVKIFKSLEKDFDIEEIQTIIRNNKGVQNLLNHILQHSDLKLETLFDDIDKGNAALNHIFKTLFFGQPTEIKSISALREAIVRDFSDLTSGQFIRSLSNWQEKMVRDIPLIKQFRHNVIDPKNENVTSQIQYVSKGSALFDGTKHWRGLSNIIVPDKDGIIKLYVPKSLSAETGRSKNYSLINLEDNTEVSTGKVNGEPYTGNSFMIDVIALDGEAVKTWVQTNRLGGRLQSKTEYEQKAIKWATSEFNKMFKANENYENKDFSKVYEALEESIKELSKVVVGRDLSLNKDKAGYTYLSVEYYGANNEKLGAIFDFEKDGFITYMPARITSEGVAFDANQAITSKKKDDFNKILETVIKGLQRNVELDIDQTTKNVKGLGFSGGFNDPVTGKAYKNYKEYLLETDALVSDIGAIMYNDKPISNYAPVGDSPLIVTYGEKSEATSKVEPLKTETKAEAKEVYAKSVKETEEFVDKFKEQFSDLVMKSSGTEVVPLTDVGEENLRKSFPNKKSYFYDVLGGKIKGAESPAFYEFKTDKIYVTPSWFNKDERTKNALLAHEYIHAVITNNELSDDLKTRLKDILTDVKKSENVDLKKFLDLYKNYEDKALFGELLANSISRPEIASALNDGGKDSVIERVKKFIKDVLNYLEIDVKEGSNLEKLLDVYELLEKYIPKKDEQVSVLEVKQEGLIQRDDSEYADMAILNAEPILLETVPFNSSQIENFPVQLEREVVEDIIPFLFNNIKGKLKDKTFLDVKIGRILSIKNQVLSDLRGFARANLERGIITQSQSENIGKVVAELEKDNSELWNKSKVYINKQYSINIAEENTATDLESDVISKTWDDKALYKEPLDKTVNSLIKDTINTSQFTGELNIEQFKNPTEAPLERFITEARQSKNRGTLTGFSKTFNSKDWIYPIAHEMQSAILNPNFDNKLEGMQKHLWKFITRKQTENGENLYGLYPLYHKLMTDENFQGAWYKSFNRDISRNNILFIESGETESSKNVSLVESNKNRIPEYIISNKWIDNMVRYFMNEKFDVKQNPEFRKTWNTRYREVLPSYLKNLGEFNPTDEKFANKLILLSNLFSDLYTDAGIPITPSEIKKIIDNKYADWKDSDAGLANSGKTFNIKEVIQKTFIDNNLDSIDNRIRTLTKVSNGQELELTGDLNRLAKELVEVRVIKPNLMNLNIENENESNFKQPTFLSDRVNDLKTGDLNWFKQFAQIDRYKYSNLLWDGSGVLDTNGNEISVKEYNSQQITKSKKVATGFLDYTWEQDPTSLKWSKKPTEVNKEFQKQFSYSDYGGNKNLDTQKTSTFKEQTGDEWYLTLFSTYGLQQGFQLQVIEDSGRSGNLSLPVIRDFAKNAVLFKRKLKNIILQEYHAMLTAKDILFDKTGNQKDVSGLEINRHFKEFDELGNPVILDKDGKVTGNVFKFSQLDMDELKFQTYLDEEYAKDGKKISFFDSKGLAIDAIGLDNNLFNRIVDSWINKLIEYSTNKGLEDFANVKEQIANLKSNGKDLFDLKTKDSFDETKWKNLVSELALNYTINNVEYNNFFGNHTDEFGSSDKYNKRAKAPIRPKFSYNPYNKDGSLATYKSVCFADRIVKSAIYDKILITLKSKRLDKTPEGQLIKKAYAAINSADGFTIISLEHMIEKDKRLGTYAGKEALYEALKNGTPLSGRDIQKLQSEKDFYNDHIFDARIGDFVTHQGKNSKFTTSIFLHGTQFEEINNLMKELGVQEINFESVEKVGSSSIVKATDEQGNLKLTPEVKDALKKGIQTRFFKYLGKQQDIVDHVEDSKNKIGVQITKVIQNNLNWNKSIYDLDGKTNTGKEIVSHFHEVYGALVTDSAHQLLGEIGARIDHETNLPMKKVGEKFVPVETNFIRTDETGKQVLDFNTDNIYIDEEAISSILTEESISRNSDNNQLFAVGYNKERKTFNLPLFAIGYIKKHFSLLTSLFTNRVTNQKINGAHSPLVSSAFFNALEGYNKASELPSKINETKRAGIDWLNTKDKSKRLESNVLKKGGKKIIEAEVLIAPTNSKFFDENGKTDINKLIADNPDLLKMIGYRIPTEGKNSTIVFKVVGFLPREYGSSIVVPDDIVKASGADFDIDTLYMMSYNLKQNQAGKWDIIKYNSGTTQRDVEERYIKWVNSQIPNTITKQNIKTLGLEKAREEVKNINLKANEALEKERLSYYQELPTIYKQKFDTLNIALDNLNVNGFNRLEYALKFSQALVNELESKSDKFKEEAEYKGEKVLYTIDKNETIGILNNLLNNYREQLEFSAYSKDKSKLKDFIGYQIKPLVEDMYHNTALNATDSLAKTYDLPTLEQFKKRNISQQNTKEANQNRLFDVMSSILQNPTHYIDNITPQDISASAEAATVVNALYDIKKSSNPNLLHNTNRLADLNRSVANLKGIFVSTKSVADICSQIGAYLRKDLGWKVKYENLTPEVIAKFKKQYGKEFTLIDETTGVVNHRYIGDNRFQSGKNVTGDKISQKTASIVAHCLDAVTSPMAYGINDQTATLYTLAAALGIEGNSHLYGALYIAQPILLEAVKRYKSTQTVFANEKAADLVSRTKSKWQNEIFSLLKKDDAVKTVNEFLSKHSFKNFGLYDDSKSFDFVENFTEFRNHLQATQASPKEVSAFYDLSRIAAMENGEYRNFKQEFKGKEANRVQVPNAIERLLKMQPNETAEPMSERELTEAIKFSQSNKWKNRFKKEIFFKAHKGEIINFYKNQIGLLEDYKKKIDMKQAMTDAGQILNIDKVGASPDLNTTRELITNIKAFDDRDNNHPRIVIGKKEQISIAKAIYPKLFNATKIESFYPMLQSLLYDSNIRSFQTLKQLDINQSRVFETWQADIKNLFGKNIKTDKIEKAANQFLNHRLVSDLSYFKNISSIEKQNLLGIDSDGNKLSFTETKENIEFGKVKISKALKDNEFSKFSTLPLYIKLRTLLTSKITPLQRFLETYGKDNILSYFEVHDNPNRFDKNGFVNIAYTYNEGNSNNMIEQFNQLWYSNNEFLHNVAEDLLKFNFLTNSFGYGLTTFKELPVNILSEPERAVKNESGFAQTYGFGYAAKLRTLQNEITSPTLIGLAESPELRERFAQNNWKLLPRVYTKKGDLKKDFPNWNPISRVSKKAKKARTETYETYESVPTGLGKFGVIRVTPQQFDNGIKHFKTGMKFLKSADYVVVGLKQKDGSYKPTLYKRTYREADNAYYYYPIPILNGLELESKSLIASNNYLDNAKQVPILSEQEILYQIDKFLINKKSELAMDNNGDLKEKFIVEPSKSSFGTYETNSKYEATFKNNVKLVIEETKTKDFIENQEQAIKNSDITIIIGGKSLETEQAKELAKNSLSISIEENNSLKAQQLFRDKVKVFDESARLTLNITGSRLSLTESSIKNLLETMLSNPNYQFDLPTIETIRTCGNIGVEEIVAKIARDIPNISNVIVSYPEDFKTESKEVQDIQDVARNYTKEDNDDVPFAIIPTRDVDESTIQKDEDFNKTALEFQKQTLINANANRQAFYGVTGALTEALLDKKAAELELLKSHKLDNIDYRNFEQELINLVNNENAKTFHESLQIIVDYNKKNLEIFGDKLGKYFTNNKLASIEGTPEEERNFFNNLYYARKFIDDALLADELFPIQNPTEKIHEKINDMITELRETNEKAKVLKTQIDSINERFWKMSITKYSSDPRIRAGLMDLMAITKDLNFLQRNALSIGNTGVKLIDLTYQKYLVYIKQAENLTAKEHIAFEKLHDKFLAKHGLKLKNEKERVAAYEKLYLKDGRLITEFDYAKFELAREAYAKSIKTKANQKQLMIAWEKANIADKTRQNGQTVLEVITEMSKTLSPDDFTKWKRENLTKNEKAFKYGTLKDEYLSKEYVENDLANDALYQHLIPLFANHLKKYQGYNWNGQYLPYVEYEHGFKAKLKSSFGFSTVREKIESFGANDELVSKIPTRFMRQLTLEPLIPMPIKAAYSSLKDFNLAKEQVEKTNAEIKARNEEKQKESGSTDIYAIAEDLIKHSNTYEAKRNMESELKNLKLWVKDQKFVRQSASGKVSKSRAKEKVTGEGIVTTNSLNAYERLDSWLQMVFYENPDYAKDPKLLKIARPLKTLTSIKVLGFNATGSMKNWLRDSIDFYKETIGGRFWTRKDSRKGVNAMLSGGGFAAFFADLDSRKKSSLASAIIHHYNIVEEHDERENIAHNVLMKRFLKVNSVYILNHSEEFFLQNKGLFTMMFSHRVVNENGENKILSFADYWEAKEKTILTDILKDKDLVKSLNDYVKTHKKEDTPGAKQDLAEDWLRINIKDEKVHQFAQDFIREKKERKAIAKAEFEKNKTLYDTYKLEDGYLKSDVLENLEGKGVSALSEAKFIERVKAVNRSLYGTYNQSDKGAMNKTVLGSLMLQFRNWLSDGWVRHFGTRFGEKMWSEERQDWDKGMLTSTWDFISKPIKLSWKEAKNTEGGTVAKAFMTVLKDFGSYIRNAKLYWNILDDYEKANVRRTATEFGAYFAMTALSAILMSLKGGTDDKKKKELNDASTAILNHLLYVTGELKDEEILYNSPYGWLNESKTLLNSPIAGSRSIEDVIKFAYSLAMYVPNQIKNPKANVFQTGTFAGMSKLQQRLFKLFPLTREPMKWYDIAHGEKNFELFRLN